MNNMKKILLAVTGMTPQVVTETLYALAVGAKWVPDEVHILTTKSGAESARLNLLTPKDGKPGKFFQLLVDYGLPPIAFSEGHIHVLQGSDGLPLDDIRSQSDNEAAADGIVNAVRELARDANTELHVSIAGGRKTMGYFLGYALSLFGRSPDRLSHVLVSPPYETNPDFFYPTPYSYPIQPKGKGMTVDAKNAKVDLAQIPFVRLADGLPKRLLEEPVSFTETVAAANRGMRLKIDVAQRKVFLQGEKLKLAPKEFWVLLWHAQKKKAGEAIH
jgi:CRISPR-associated protein (TIGR02584 family)